MLSRVYHLPAASKKKRRGGSGPRAVRSTDRYCLVTATAVLADTPGLQAGVHFDGSEHAAPFPAAGVEAAVAVAADFEPSGHEPNGQCAGSVQ